MTVKGEELTKLVQTNEQKITELDKSRKEIEDNHRNQVYKLKYEIYGQKIKALEDERDNTIEALSNAKNDTVNEIGSVIKKLYEPIAKAKRIIEFLRIPKDKKVDVNDNDIILRESYSYGKKRQFESLGFLINEDLLEIKLYIIGNDKPKNYLDLVAFGKCFFDNEILNVNYHTYGVSGAYTHNYYQIECVFQSFATVESLKEWLEKHRSKLLKDLIDAYQNTKTEYFETLKEYTVNDFEPFITLKCPKCGNFRTVFDSSYNYYSEKPCSRCESTIEKTNVKQL